MNKKTYRREASPQNPTRQKSLAIGLIALLLVSAMVVPLVVTRNPGTALRTFESRYEVGSLANEDVFAFSSFEYVDGEKTERLVAEAVAKVIPYFSYSLHATSASVLRVQKFIEYWKNENNGLQTLDLALPADSANVLARFRELDSDERSFMLAALEETSELVLQKGLFSSDDIQKNLQSGYENFYLENSISMDKVTSLVAQSLDSAMTFQTMQENLAFWLAAYTNAHSSFQPLLLLDTLSLLVESNVQYNEAKTLHLRELAKAEVKPQIVTIQRGQKIIAKDSVITSEQMALITRMSDSAFDYTVLELIGRFVFVVLATGAGLLVFHQFLKHEKRYYLYLNLLLASLVVTLGLLYLVAHWTTQNSVQFIDSFLPVLFAPIFLSQITTKKRVGLVSGFILSCYAMILPYSNSMTFFFTMTTVGTCLYFFQFTIKRLDEIFNWFYACLVSCFMAIALNLLNGFSFNGVGALLGGLVINISLSVVFVAALVPLCEQLFNIPTIYRLSELALAESPALERLAVVAQGTYTHSRYVADIAYTAAKAIGANAMLARVGGMYHDIGKSDHPEYFIENQGVENKHDEIKPSLSVAIIKSHVKLGVEKGREAGLPQEVLDIIAQHHGNDVIQFFFHEAKEQAQALGLDVNEDDYSYAGIRPSTPEAAIVMLADCVEAASRTLKKATPSKYEKLIHTVIMGKIARDQLKDSLLSLTDLDLISASFLQSLVGRDHHRIEYPDDATDTISKAPVKG
ncbi:HDIG domain-containing metalloprotein [Sphaerochaeta sp. PS]|uniref:HDIG domain-containing metalloprotein n=1 Tax=Sphaerochaeta sp. PS TaxID=3076336 RepID=UPI0028A44697|nr:HDIG domain-containing metalloprotein [Sphaerochaeta sp. PS]MDT4761535.1 HDIG domain-containing protein [Sphaerochaeta sp. PS]